MSNRSAEIICSTTRLYEVKALRACQALHHSISTAAAEASASIMTLTCSAVMKEGTKMQVCALQAKNDKRSRRCCTENSP